VFAAVYCTSRLADTEDTDSPTYFPTSSAGGTTNPPASIPSIPSITSSPSTLNSVPPSPGQPATLIPSVQGLSRMPSTKLPSESSLPSSSSPLSIGSVGPTSDVGGSAGPTSGMGGSEGPSITTMLPTNSGSPTKISPGSQLPVESIRPTLTPRPTGVIGSAGPNLSSRPSYLTGSNAPTVFQGASPGPSSQKPSVVNVTISTVPSSRSPSENNTEASPTPSVTFVSSASPNTDDIFIENAGSTPPPSTSSLNSTEPITDDIFIELRNVNRGKNERKCNTNNMPTESLKEFELSFMYGIESSSNDVYEYTDDMESLILDIVASTVLICASQSDAHISQRSKRLDGGIRDSGAVRIRYPEYGEITSICESFNIVLLLCLCNHICLISRTSNL